LNGETGEKTVVDLAIPADLDVSVSERFKVDYISIGYLKTISESNLNARKKELIQVRQIIYEAVEEFKQIFKMRQVEIKMRCIPEKVKEIKEKALAEVFEKDLQKLDEDGLEVVNKILNYMEKKYVSVPMLMAKQMIDNKEFNNNEN
jgi:glutamyl-tRNA reductase